MQKLLGVLMAAAMLGFAPALADQPKNFVVSIDGTEYPIDPGEKLTVKGKGGAEFQLGLRQSDVGTFHGDFVSFQHGKGQNVTSTQIGSDTKQHMIATNLGSLVLVQEYAGIDPRSLAELMLKQLSKDDIRDGGEMEKKPGKREIAGGVTLEGLTAKIVIKKTGVTRTIRMEVMTGGTSDHGIVAVSRIDNEAGPDDEKMVARFWDSMSVKY